MKKIDIDSTNGGNGDIWMRLVAFYAIAGLKPDVKITLYIPQFMRPLAKITFGDRLSLCDARTNEMKIEYSNMGIRHLIPGILKGKKYISSFQKSNFMDRKHRGIKDYINMWLFSLADFFNIIIVPPFHMSQKYHGYIDSASIKQFREIDFTQFSNQVKRDRDILKERLNGEIPLSPELQVPNDLEGKIVFFANGTSRQFVPVEWAKTHFKEAYFAFFYAEKEYTLFKEQGLNVIPYYKEPGDLIAIAKKAKRVLCTDSFPSHLLQSVLDDMTAVITEVIPERVISPSFKGHLVNSEVACHPCIHMTRAVPCAAGYFECLNWKNDKYVANIKKALMVEPII